MNQPEPCYVILHLSHDPSQGEVRAGARIIVETGDPPFYLTENIWGERFDKNLGEKIQTACDPSHYNIKSAGYDRHLYAFVKRITEPEKAKK